MSSVDYLAYVTASLSSVREWAANDGLTVFQENGIDQALIRILLQGSQEKVSIPGLLASAGSSVEELKDLLMTAYVNELNLSDTHDNVSNVLRFARTDEININELHKRCDEKLAVVILNDLAKANTAVSLEIIESLRDIFHHAGVQMTREAEFLFSALGGGRYSHKEYAAATLSDLPEIGAAEVWKERNHPLMSQLRATISLRNGLQAAAISNAGYSMPGQRQGQYASASDIKNTISTKSQDLDHKITTSLRILTSPTQQDAYANSAISAIFDLKHVAVKLICQKDLGAFINLARRVNWTQAMNPETSVVQVICAPEIIDGFIKQTEAIPEPHINQFMVALETRAPAVYGCFVKNIQLGLQPHAASSEIQVGKILLLERHAKLGSQNGGSHHAKSVLAGPDVAVA